MPLLAGYRFLIPIMGMIESLVILRENPGRGLIAGGVLVIGSLVAAQRSAVDPKSVEAPKPVL